MFADWILRIRVVKGEDFSDCIKKEFIVVFIFMFNVFKRKKKYNLVDINTIEVFLSLF